MLNKSIPDIATAARWVNERHAVFLRKNFLEGKVPPEEYAPVFPLIESTTWTLDHLTTDPILSQWRFTNAFRELDRVTVWIRQHVREPYADHPDLWFMIAVARLFNWPPTLEMLMNTDGAWPSHSGFSLENVTAALGRWKAAGNKSETGAFMTRAENNANQPWSGWPKHKYLSEVVLGRLWADRDFFQRLFDWKPDVRRVWERLQGYYGWGSFLSGQVTTDLRHTRYLDQAADRASWAALGPGSAKGLNLLHGRPIKAAVTQGEAVAEMREIQKMLPEHLAPWVPKNIELTDTQNICCELSKYLALKDGSRAKGKVKYVPGRGS
jgi:alpha-glutamyl/putrescinyl thymine pyrophosphorylase clade 1